MFHQSQSLDAKITAMCRRGHDMVQEVHEENVMLSHFPFVPAPKRPDVSK
jgi:hypothetical protein